MERRLLLAFVISAAILLAWSILFPPPQAPVRPAPDRVGPAPTATATAGPLPTAADETTEAAPASPPTVAEPRSSDRIEEVTLTNENIRVVVTNRGAAIASYQLLKYDDDSGEVLDLVQTVPLPAAALPLQLVSDGGPDERLYALEPAADGVELLWADGAGNAVSKRIGLSGAGYGLDVEVIATGRDAAAPISVGTGMRDLGETERNSRLALWGEGIVLADGEVERLKRRKVKATQVIRPSSLTFAGFEDAYFLNLLRPRGAVEEVQFEPLEVGADGEDPERVLRISVVPSDGELRGQLLGAPKEYDLLQQIDQGIDRTLDFGFFHPISVFFLKALRWIHGWAANWGLAIILLTLGIRIVLFPLMHTSTVSMRKMAKVQPKVKEIQAKYKKKKGDPQARAKMNQEMMALYKTEGVNPMAGCLPLLVQLPLLWALYQLFLHAIELRHAPFMLWITDLSAKDPLYVTPVLMTATMWLQQRLAPQAGDPQQQRIMRMMPLIFGIMFLQFPAGLVLYWLSNNVITILQQEITLHLVGERKGLQRKRRGGAKK